MEQYPLVRLGQAEGVTDLDRRPPLDVPQREHLALGGGSWSIAAPTSASVSAARSRYSGWCSQSLGREAQWPGQSGSPGAGTGRGRRSALHRRPALRQPTRTGWTVTPSPPGSGRCSSGSGRARSSATSGARSRRCPAAPPSRSPGRPRRRGRRWRRRARAVRCSEPWYRSSSHANARSSPAQSASTRESSSA